MQRHDGRRREIGVLQLFAGVIEDFAELHRDPLEMCDQRIKLGRGQGGEKMVLLRTRK